MPLARMVLPVQREIREIKEIPALKALKAPRDLLVQAHLIT